MLVVLSSMVAQTEQAEGASAKETEFAILLLSCFESQSCQDTERMHSHQGNCSKENEHETTRNLGLNMKARRRRLAGFAM